MSRTTRFVDLLRIYRIQESTLFALIETNETATLRFDLDHCDDAERCPDGTDYLLDVAVPRERFMIIDGRGERPRGSFSACILTATHCAFWRTPPTTRVSRASWR